MGDCSIKNFVVPADYLNHILQEMEDMEADEP
jgi:hypothetical protein